MPKTSDESICEATQWFTFDKKQAVKLTGKRLGTVTLIVARTPKGTTPAAKEDYVVLTIHVRRDERQLAELQNWIRATLQIADFTITTTPDTTKVVLSGTVPSPCTAEEIVALVESPELPRTAVINHLKPQGPLPGEGVVGFDNHGGMPRLFHRR